MKVAIYDRLSKEDDDGRKQRRENQEAERNENRDQLMIKQSEASGSTI